MAAGGPTSRSPPPFRDRSTSYISPDKNPKQLRTEQGCRKLFRAFKAVHPDKSVHQDKRSGVVSVEWHPCAKVVPDHEPHSFTVQWNVSALERTSVNKQSVMEAFNASTGSESGIQWQI